MRLGLLARLINREVETGKTLLFEDMGLRSFYSSECADSGSARCLDHSGASELDQVTVWFLYAKPRNLPLAVSEDLPGAGQLIFQVNLIQLYGLSVRFFTCTVGQGQRLICSGAKA